MRLKHKEWHTTAVDLYRQGLSLSEVSKEVGIAKQRVHVVLQQLVSEGLRPRGTAKGKPKPWLRRKLGPRSNRRTDVCPKALHDRVRFERGAPSECVICKTTDSTRNYDWANLTGCYLDIYDFARLCRACHSMYDTTRRRFAENGITVQYKPDERTLWFVSDKFCTVFPVSEKGWANIQLSLGSEKCEETLQKVLTS